MISTINKYLLVHFILIIPVILISCNEANVSGKYDEDKDYTQFVNPFIGTGGHGHTFPGAVVPNGMVQLSPDTRFIGWDASSGYHYSDNSIAGFSHTHLSGTGIGGFGDVLIMPFTGNISLKPGSVTPEGHRSSFQKKNETAQPGYYSVFLDDFNVMAELTVTERAGFHRYTFPEADKSGIVINLASLIMPERRGTDNITNEFQIISDTEIAGLKQTTGWAANQYVYFYAKTSKPFKAELFEDGLSVSQQTTLVTKRGQAILNFSTDENEKILVKVGISSVDIEGAKNNLLTEIDHWDFDLVKESARQKWNSKLSKIEVIGGTADQKAIFYTSLYRSYIHPSLYTDVDGRYRGIDWQIHQTDRSDDIYTVFSLWDTYRALHPLLTIISPSLNTRFINTLLNHYQKGGILPIWELAGNYTGTMIGYHAVSLIADAYTKGDRGFDIELAYEAMLNSARFDTTGFFLPSDRFDEGYLNHYPEMQQHIRKLYERVVHGIPNYPFGIMPVSRYYNESHGFIPADKVKQSVSKALEYAYNDWCIAQVSRELGKEDDYQYFMERANRYKRYFDASTGFMRGINADGTWRADFDPRNSDRYSSDFTEGNSFQYSWYVPHDVDGLIELLGGKKEMEIKLDTLFNTQSEMTGDRISTEISGLIGLYAHGNEPSHHLIYLYNYTQQPWKAQALLDSVMNYLYRNKPDGIAGNEDCGQLSAWYVMSAVGFYQICPGKPEYALGRPLFDKAVINLENGKTFKIIARNNNKENKYVKSVTINGKEHKSWFISHDIIMAGGEMVFTMSGQPPLQ